MVSDTILIACSVGALLCLVLYLQRRRSRKMREFTGRK